MRRCVLFDGTLWRDDEMIVAGVGDKIGSAHGPYELQRCRTEHRRLPGSWTCARKLFIHINNTNPLLIADSAERQAKRVGGLGNRR